MKQSEISFYVDTLIVEAILCDENPGNGLRKEASVVGDLLAKVKEYTGQHIDQNDKAGSVINMLAPGAITMALGAMGFGWWRILVGLAVSVFHINVAGIFESAWGALKGMIGGNKQVSGPEVDSMVQNAVRQNTTTISSDEEAQKAQEQAKNIPGLTTSARLRQARMLKLAMIEYDRVTTYSLTKEGLSLNPLQWFGKGQGSTSSLLGTIISWIFKVVLASAGLMVAGDVINKFLGRPNAIDKTYQAGQPEQQTQSAPPAPRSTQTKFPLNAGYNEGAHPRPWIEQTPNNAGSISNMLVGWAKEVYSGLNGKEGLITSSPAFQAIVEQIAWYNHTSAGDNMVVIPTMYSNKKSLVDYFIDDVAQKAK